MTGIHRRIGGPVQAGAAVPAGTANATTRGLQLPLRRAKRSASQLARCIVSGSRSWFQCNKFPARSHGFERGLVPQLGIGFGDWAGGHANQLTFSI